MHRILPSGERLCSAPTTFNWWAVMAFGKLVLGNLSKFRGKTRCRVIQRRALLAEQGIGGELGVSHGVRREREVHEPRCTSCSVLC